MLVCLKLGYTLKYCTAHAIFEEYILCALELEVLHVQSSSNRENLATSEAQLKWLMDMKRTY